MSNKKSARKATGTTASADLPNWRAKLMSIPEEKRCRSQKDLARALKLLDLQLDLFKPSTKPSPDISDRDGMTAVLAEFEVDFLRFHLNNCVPLYPANRFPDIMPWLSDNQTSDWMLLRYLEENPEAAAKPFSQFEEGALERILSSALKILFMHFHACSAGNSSKPYNFDSFASFWSGWQARRWGELEAAGANEILAEHGSRLKIKDFRLLSQGVVICFLGFDARQKSDPEAAITAWQRLVEWAPTVLAGPVMKPFCTFWWFFSYRVQDILEIEVGAATFDDVWHISRRSDRWLRLNILAQSAMRTNKIILAQQILEAVEAEQPRDDALLAYAYFNQAEVMAMGLEPWKYSDVEKLLEQGEDALKKCKSWFPSLFRKLLKSQLAEPAEGYLAAVRRKYPRDFRTISWKSCVKSCNGRGDNGVLYQDGICCADAHVCVLWIRRA
jgi:hypothetical protein